MCTYETTVLSVRGSGKGQPTWFPVTQATVYFDHPVSAPYLHSLNIDVMNPDAGPSARVALELDPGAARELAHAILDLLDKNPPELLAPPSVPEP